MCMAITDTEVRATIAAGATTREEITRRCRACGDCGSCLGMIDHMLEAHAATLRCDGEHVVPAEQLVRPRRAA